MRRLLIVVALLLPAHRAAAETSNGTPLFLTAFGEGTLSSQIWSATSGTPSVSATTSPTRWGLDIDPAAGAAEYARATMATADTDQSFAFNLAVRLDTLPSYTCATSGAVCDPTVLLACGSGDSCSVINHRQLGGAMVSSNLQCFPAIGSDGKVRVFWKDMVRECTANSLYRYTECTADAQCPPDTGGNAGETFCAESIFAKSPSLSLATEHNVAVIQTADTGGARPFEVTCSLYVDGFLRGAKTRWEGLCSGGTNSGKACGASSDCGGGTCAQAALASPTTLQLGDSQTTGSKAFDVRILGAAYFTSATEASAKFAKYVHHWPNTASSQGWDIVQGCASNYDCEDEVAGGVAPDNDTTVLNTSTQNAKDIYAITDYTPAGGESVIASAVRMTVQEQADNANTGKTVRVGLRSNTTSDAWGTAFDLSDYAGAYVTLPGPITNVVSSSGDWTLNNTRLQVENTGTSGSGNRVRVTALAADTYVGKTLPTIPDTLPAGSDLKKTICILGDSTVNDTTLYDEINATLEEGDNLLRCATGGRTAYDVRTNAQNLLNGYAAKHCIGGSNDGGTCSTGFDCPGGGTCGDMLCVAERGENAPCDVAFIHWGANDFASYATASDSDGTCAQRGCVGGAAAGQPCTDNTDCTGGTCTDFQGPQNGAACDIPLGWKSESSGSWLTRWYCAAGSTIGTCCSGVGCTASTCGNPQKCSNSNTPCDVDAECSPGTCNAMWGITAGRPVHTDKDYGPGYCAPGSPVSKACPRGVCLRRPSATWLAQEAQLFVDYNNSRTQPAVLVWMGNADPCTDTTTKYCVGGTNHGQTCASDANCAGTGAKCYVTGVTANWNTNVDLYRWNARFLERFAAATGDRFIDVGAYFRRVSPLAPDANLRDCIHWSDFGQTNAGDLIVACLENISMPENKCGSWP